MVANYNNMGGGGFSTGGTNANINPPGSPAAAVSNATGDVAMQMMANNNTNAMQTALTQMNQLSTAVSQLAARLIGGPGGGVYESANGALLQSAVGYALNIPSVANWTGYGSPNNFDAGVKMMTMGSNMGMNMSTTAAQQFREQMTQTFFGGGGGAATVMSNTFGFDRTQMGDIAGILGAQGLGQGANIVNQAGVLDESWSNRAMAQFRDAAKAFKSLQNVFQSNDMRELAHYAERLVGTTMIGEGAQAVSERMGRLRSFSAATGTDVRLNAQQQMQIADNLRLMGAGDVSETASEGIQMNMISSMQQGQVNQREMAGRGFRVNPMTQEEAYQGNAANFMRGARVRRASITGAAALASGLIPAEFQDDLRSAIEDGSNATSREEAADAERRVRLLLDRSRVGIQDFEDMLGGSENVMNLVNTTKFGRDLISGVSETGEMLGISQFLMRPLKQMVNAQGFKGDAATNMTNNLVKLAQNKNSSAVARGLQKGYTGDELVKYLREEENLWDDEIEEIKALGLDEESMAGRPMGKLLDNAMNMIMAMPEDVQAAMFSGAGATRTAVGRYRHTLASLSGGTAVGSKGMAKDFFQAILGGESLGGLQRGRMLRMSGQKAAITFDTDLEKKINETQAQNMIDAMSNEELKRLGFEGNYRQEGGAADLAEELNSVEGRQRMLERIQADPTFAYSITGSKRGSKFSLYAGGDKVTERTSRYLQDQLIKGVSGEAGEDARKFLADQGIASADDINKFMDSFKKSDEEKTPEEEGKGPVGGDGGVINVNIVDMNQTLKDLLGM
jgi:hypothetical protein